MSLPSKFFAANPARDARFTLVDTWKECANFERGHPEKEIEFFHRQAHEELNAVENCSRNLSDFPDAPWDVRMYIARQAYDEARHVEMFLELYKKRGGVIGKYPVMCFQYRICTMIATLLGRLSVQNRTFEAGGIDAVTAGIDDARSRGDEELALLYEAQGSDEIQHVRFANEWIRDQVFKVPRNALVMAMALTQGAEAFTMVMGEEGVEGLSYGADSAGRRAAGFDEAEVEQAKDHADARLREQVAR